MKDGDRSMLSVCDVVYLFIFCLLPFFETHCATCLALYVQ